MHGTPQKHEKNVFRIKRLLGGVKEVSKEDQEMIEKDLIQFSRKAAELRRQKFSYASSSIMPSVDEKAFVFSLDM